MKRFRNRLALALLVFFEERVAVPREKYLALQRLANNYIVGRNPTDPEPHHYREDVIAAGFQLRDKPVVPVEGVGTARVWNFTVNTIVPFIGYEILSKWIMAMKAWL